MVMVVEPVEGNLTTDYREWMGRDEWGRIEPRMDADGHGFRWEFWTG
jgi:hypothetical protein